MAKLKTKVLEKAKVKHDYQKIGVIVDYGQADFTWQKKHGYVGAPLMATNFKTGEVIGRSGTKIEIKEGNLVTSMNERIPFIPHEAVAEVVKNLPDRIGKTFGHKGFAIEYTKEKFSHGGKSAYWLVQTNIEDTVPHSYVNDDKLKFGFSIRNGYSTGVALGIDLFSFRLWCSNGAIQRGRDFGTVAIRHVGKNPELLIKVFEEKLMLAVDGWTNLLDLYKKLTAVKLTDKMAEYIYKKTWIADKYYPEYFQIATGKEKKKLVEKEKPVVALTAQGKSVTLWENFNDLTGDLWHAHDSEDPKHVVKKPISYYDVSNKEVRLHTAMNTIVNDLDSFR